MASLSVSLRIEDEGWKKILEKPQTLLAKAARAALKAGASDLEGKVEIAILLTDDGEMKTLNRMWRQKNKPTNVLSFPALAEASAPGQPVFLGDLAMGLGTVLKEAKAQGKKPEAHAMHLTAHGVLHLLGFDHMDAKAAREMEALEKDVMKKLGYPDPYGQGKR